MVKGGQRLVYRRQQLALFQRQRPTFAATGKLTPHGFDRRQRIDLEGQGFGANQLAHLGKKQNLNHESRPP